MNIGTRKILDRSFTAVGIGSIIVMAVALMIVVVPIITNGIGAVFFTGTVEHRKMLFSEFKRGDSEGLSSEVASSERYRAKVYEMLTGFEAELETMAPEKKAEYKSKYAQVRAALQALLGPLPGDSAPMLTGSSTARPGGRKRRKNCMISSMSQSGTIPTPMLCRKSTL